MVTIASCTPRMRKAGSATSMPSAAATRAQTRIASGNGTSQAVVSFDSVNPAAPAKADCASEIWPR